MTTVYLDRVFAWNLVDELIQSETVGGQGGYVAGLRAEGIIEGWLSPSNRRSVREAMVYANKLILPGEVDADVRPLEGHIKYETAPNSNWSLTNQSQAEAEQLFSELKPIVLQQINRRTTQIEEWNYDSYINYLLETRSGLDPGYSMYVARLLTRGHRNKQIKRRNARGRRSTSRVEVSEDRLKRWSKTGTLIHRELDRLMDMAVLGSQGIPTLTEPITLTSSEASQNQERDTLALVGLYFSNCIYTPSPKNFAEVLELRENKSIVVWRKQLHKWSLDLLEGKSSISSLKKEIETANEYVRGGEFTARLVPEWSVFFTLPIGAVAQFVPELHSVGWLLLGIEALKAYGNVIEMEVKRAERKTFPWLMIGNN